MARQASKRFTEDELRELLRDYWLASPGGKMDKAISTVVKAYRFDLNLAIVGDGKPEIDVESVLRGLGLEFSPERLIEEQIELELPTTSSRVEDVELLIPFFLTRHIEELRKRGTVSISKVAALALPALIFIQRKTGERLSTVIHRAVVESVDSDTLWGDSIGLPLEARCEEFYDSLCCLPPNVHEILGLGPISARNSMDHWLNNFAWARWLKLSEEYSDELRRITEASSFSPYSLITDPERRWQPQEEVNTPDPPECPFFVRHVAYPLESLPDVIRKLVNKGTADDDMDALSTTQIADRWEEAERALIKAFTAIPAKQLDQSPAAAVKAYIADKLNGNVRWGEISIVFRTSEDVKIKVVDFECICNYAQLGFQNQQKSGPVKCWAVLELLGRKPRIDFEYIAAQGSNDAARTRKDWNALKQHMTQIRRKLMEFFGLDDDPFQPFHLDKAYILKLTVEHQK